MQIDQPLCDTEAGSFKMMPPSSRSFHVSKPEPPARLIQAISKIIYSCATETQLFRIGTPILQGLVSIFGGRMQFSSKTPRSLFTSYV